MKKEDAELKAKALAKDLVKKEAVNKDSGQKCIVVSVEAIASINKQDDFEVVCFCELADSRRAGKKLKEEIDHFLRHYKVLLQNVYEDARN